MKRVRLEVVPSCGANSTLYNKGDPISECAASLVESMLTTRKAQQRGWERRSHRALRQADWESSFQAMSNGPK